MATVYRARDRRLGREVAVKLIHPHLRQSPEVAARFVSEARAVAMLKHPNIVEVYDISDEAEAERYLVVELVRGPTLRELLKRYGRLPPEVAAIIGLFLARGLAHAHEQGIIHRDVKPENVLLELPERASHSEARDSSERCTTKVKLTDFGIAKLLDAQGVTSTGQVLGSPAHMAPEQIEGGHVGPRSDVFALGVLMYEAMVGHLPFDGKNPAQVLRRVLDGHFDPAHREEPRVGARYSAVLSRALARAPEERFESIEAFGEAVEEELEELGITHPELELERFTTDPQGYIDEHPGRMATALVASGERARDRGRMGLAADQFNRALAYRPGDPELLSRVSALGRRARLGKAVRWGAPVLAAGVIAAVGSVVWRGRAPEAVSAEGLRDDARKRVHPELGDLPEPPLPQVPREAASAARAAPAQPERASGRVGSNGSTRSQPRRAPVLRPVESARPNETRPVRVVVHGGKRGHLLIDGHAEEWFGTTHDLSVGQEHVFEFVLEDDECCRQASPVRRVIEAGQGPVSVHIENPYRDARLSVSPDAPGGTLACPALIGKNAMRVPGTRRVSMSRPDANGECTFVPDHPEASPPVSKEVRLRAGRTTVLNLP